MKKPKILYFFIILICIIALGVGVYKQFLEPKAPETPGEIENPQENIVENPVEEPEEKTFEEMKEAFNAFFENKFVSKDADEEVEVEKKKKAEDIVYTVFTKKEETDFYNIDINVPFINIKGDIPDGYNQITQNVFLKKANELLTNTDKNKKAIYSIDYAAYLNGDILSVVIKSSLKQKDNPQRLIIQTYNYNIKTKQKVTLNDILQMREISNEEVNSKITDMIEEAIQAQDTLTSSGYTVYERNLNDEIYTVGNISTFFFGEDSKLYIIFAYGNRNFTSEMDVIEF